MEKFEPVCEKRRALLLDTDIGPDCDDAGAVATLWRLCERWKFPVLGMVNCTSNEWGCGALRAINKYYGREVPCGMYGGEGFLKDTKRYNAPVSKQFGCAPGGTEALTLYRELLEGAEDDGVVFVTIGPLKTAAELVRGAGELFARKVHAVVAMAAAYPFGREYNVYCDAGAAKYFFENVKKPVIISGFEVGKTVVSGFAPEEESKYADDPVFHAYKLHTNGRCVNSSYDLTAVHFAIEGESTGWFTLTDPMSLAIAEDGSNRFTPDPEGAFRCMVKNKSDEELGAFYTALLHE